MSSTQQFDREPTDPGDIFAAWLVRIEAGEVLDFEDLVRAHPALEQELRGLHDDWKRFAPILSNALSKLEGGVAELPDALRGKVMSGGSVSPEVRAQLTSRPDIGERYRFREVLGEGGGGVVLSIWDAKLRRPLAMKIALGADGGVKIGAHGLADQRRLTRFVDEARIASQLTHPGIVPIHELGSDDAGHAYFTMKLVKGENLEQILEKARSGADGWNRSGVLNVLLRACETVAYAHDHHVIHRDLKPANIMVGAYGEVYVMDWGLARVSDDAERESAPSDAAKSITQVDSLRHAERINNPTSPIVTMDGDSLGTPQYMPPEQAIGEPTLHGPRSDVYAMGAILYQVLTGSPPYVAEGDAVSPADVVRGVMRGPPTPVEDLAPDAAPELVAICKKAMQRDVDERYPDMSGFAEDLRNFVEGRVVLTYERGTRAQLRKWIGRNRSLASALATAMLAIVAGSVLVLIQNVRLVHANETAESNADLARQREQDVYLLAARDELEELVENAKALWPPHPDGVAAMDAWLSKASGLIEGRPADPELGVEERPSLRSCEAKLEALRAKAKAIGAPSTDEVERVSSGTESLAQLEAAAAALADDPQLLGVTDSETELRLRKVLQAAQERTRDAASAAWAYEFTDPRDAWLHKQLSALVSELRAFADERTGLLSNGCSPDFGWGVPRRRAFALEIEVRSQTLADSARAWRSAIDSIAADSRYGRLVLTPQMGLLPIGRDPDSGLWEFAHLQSGVAPTRGADGHLKRDEETAIVLVLVPGGDVFVGAQRTDSSGVNYDQAAAPIESPPHLVPLAPYFLSKFEMTQAQWERATAANPSDFGPRHYQKTWNSTGAGWSAMHPVERVSWDDCVDVLARMDLRLPREAEWERAARAGEKDRPWSTGAEVATLAKHANIADRFGAECDVGWWSAHEYESSIDDGQLVHAEVGSFLPNAYGLYDMHGNVAEWCEEQLAPYRSLQVGGTLPDTTLRVQRGGSFDNAAAAARSSARAGTGRANRFNMLGVRPARSVK